MRVVVRCSTHHTMRVCVLGPAVVRQLIDWSSSVGARNRRRKIGVSISSPNSPTLYFCHIGSLLPTHTSPTLLPTCHRRGYQAGMVNDYTQ